MNGQRFQINIVPSYYSAADLMLLTTITPVHAGIGRTGGTVDLPIQRDSWGLPCIWGSSIKGALRTAFRGGGSVSDDEVLIFGPEREDAWRHAGALNILDARLLLLPTPSLKGGYVFATTDLMIERSRTIWEISKKEDLAEEAVKLRSALSSSRKALVSSDKVVLSGKVWVGDKAFETDMDQAESVKKFFESIFKLSLIHI